jgi:TRAP-type transport system small permease protein
MSRNPYSAVMKGIFFLAIGLMAGLILTVFLNVVSRYVFNSSILWSEEAARFLFIWVSFLGVVMVADKGEHMALSLLLDNIKGPLAITVKYFANSVVLLLSLLVGWGGAIVTIESFDWLSPVLSVPYGLVYAIAPVCSLILVWQALRNFRGNEKTRTREAR